MTREEKLRCEDISLKDIDDNPNNNTHEHIEISEEYLDKCATKILENDEDKEKGEYTKWQEEN